MGPINAPAYPQSIWHQLHHQPVQIVPPVAQAALLEQFVQDA